VAGSIFGVENRAIFSESFFGRGIFGRNITCLQLVPSNWLWRGFINHKRREHVQWRNFTKEGFIKEENTFNEGISLPRRRPTLLDPYHENTGLLQIERNFLVEWVVRTIFYEGSSMKDLLWRIFYEGSSMKEFLSEKSSLKRSLDFRRKKLILPPAWETPQFYKSSFS